MKLSYQWLVELVPGLRLSPEAVAEKLTFSGTEIEGIERVQGDTVINAAVTSNRVDLLGHLGLAREVAALLGLPVAEPSCTVETSGPDVTSVTRVDVPAPDLCPRSVARVMTGLRVGPSPAWLVARLGALGQRSVNNVVDVTNLVMLEQNHPLHAFDLDRLSGRRIVVRRARDGERMVALNGQELRLVPDDLVIADADRPVALAGVMGGAETEVSAGTTSILLESAYFSPPSVRKTGRRHGLKSEAGFRFERGVDRAAARRAADRACRLLREVAGGTVLVGAIDVGGEGERASPISFRPERVAAVAAFSLPEDDLARLLEALGCGVERKGRPWSVTPPTWRADLFREIDLVEEIVRNAGLDRVPEETAMEARTVAEHPMRALRERIKDRMVALGFIETVTPDFVAEERLGSLGLVAGPGTPVLIKNPVRAGEGALRRSLLGSLLQVRKHNQDHGNQDIRLFELANLQIAAAPGARPEATPVLGMLADADLREVRGVVEALADHLGFAISIEPGTTVALEVGASGEIRSGGVPLGHLGYPTGAVLRDFGLKSRPVVVELDLRRVHELAQTTKRFRGLPRFPAVVRDLALLVAEAVPFGAVAAEIRGLAIAELEALDAFEVYRDAKKLGAGKKSLNIRLTFRLPDATLTTEAVDAQVARVVARLGESLGAEVRGA